MSGIYELKKNSPGCTGMFWRADPRDSKGAPSDNWPRDGAELKGTVVDVPGKGKYLQVDQIKQKADSDFKAAPAGAFMPFQYAQYFLEEK
mmetsp:Transcript_15422/g.23918  ORF Transcript_15422/g.23918 Transcript_15422/m.23918 type:complete len:90 (-) Transcript_15422:245-514(-)|eukprot:CAMPEP_0196807412 /NCGR_PEP_ID=MMETSP1362-20130617/7394_1 /TAXON_ID=163516 /ORGANISM="Leptocylindrus danicus, Strain CCMP1856" /LENGTH=89 /DNA_ID=CAMNT_0042181331 /DNA_START=67 /DNA_END=336 /DNA_ORIENTATION=+